jgi:peptidoglycan/xylan/chitin deacetylase (PgdA/CDA1 family)
MFACSDGPFDNTPTALQILRWKQVKATFFVVGTQIPGREAIMCQIVADGHYVGSHSQTHPQ